MGQNKYASLHPKLILLSLRHKLCPVTAGTKHVKQATRACGLSYSACPGTELLQWLQGTFLLNLRILEEEVDSHNRKGTLPQVTEIRELLHTPPLQGGRVGPLDRQHGAGRGRPVTAWGCVPGFLYSCWAPVAGPPDYLIVSVKCH